jgi:hypothetical protein
MTYEMIKHSIHTIQFVIECLHSGPNIERQDVLWIQATGIYERSLFLPLSLVILLFLDPSQNGRHVSQQSLLVGQQDS